MHFISTRSYDINVRIALSSSGQQFGPALLANGDIVPGVMVGIEVSLLLHFI
jgi:hypothetical protein